VSKPRAGARENLRPLHGARVAAIKQGDPLDPSTMVGAQASSEQLEKILSYIDIGKQEGAQVLARGARTILDGGHRASSDMVFCETLSHPARSACDAVPSARAFIASFF